MEKQQPQPGASRPSHQPSGVPIARGDAGVWVSDDQQAAEQAALIAYGRQTAPSRALDRPSLVHVDVSWMPDDELDNWLDPDVQVTQDMCDRLLNSILDGLKEVKANRTMAWLNFINDPSMPPDWVTAIASLPLEE